MKLCTKCGQPGEFSKDRSKKDGLKSWCKACYKAWREANREQSKAWYQANREKVAEQKKAWRESNREKIAEQSKAWYQANREKVAEQKKAYREANPDKIAELSKAWYEANREKKAELSKAWYQANPEKKKEYKHRRRARKAGAAGNHTEQQWQARLAYHGGKCYYCGCDGKMEIEHRIPLSRGGSNWPANLVPACKSCNRRKHNKTEFEYDRAAYQRVDRLRNRRTIDGERGHRTSTRGPLFTTCFKMPVLHVMVGSGCS